MISVTLIGSGNVGFHLAKAFLNSKEIELKQLYTRNIKDLEFWKNKVSTTSSLSSLINADVTFILVSDDAISEVSKKINNSFVVHTSGAKEIDELANTTNKGVFYPLQSFSKNKEVDFSQVPFCIEANDSKDLIMLENLVQILGAKAFHINSEQRKRIHVAAVFANNFTNHMYKIARDICTEHQIPFDIFLPLIEETAKKIYTLSPDDAQTGPAKRNDQKTILNHLNLLNASQKKLYKTITESIQSYGKKL